MTEQAKHTPGPWVKCEDKGCDFLIFASEAEDSVLIADCYARGQPMSVRQMEANTKLIAAAPEMVEALKDCLDYFERRSGLSARASEEFIRAVLQKAGVSAELPSFEDVRGILGAPEEED